MKCLLLLISIFFLPFSIFYLPSCYAAQWIQKGETAFAEGETAETHIYGSGASANIRLESSDSDEWGNEFVSEDKKWFNLDVTNKKTSCRFIAFSNINVDKLHIYFKFVAPTPATYTVGIQTDTTGHKPSGTWVSKSTFTPAVEPEAWQEIMLDTPASLTAGSTYHLVIEYKSGTIANYISIGYTSPQNYKIPYSSSKDAMSEFLTFGGSNWTYEHSQPVYVLEDSGTSLYEGNPFAIGENHKIYGPSSGPCEWWCEEITITGSDKSVNKVDFYVRSYGGTPTDDLYVVLKIKDGEVMEEGTFVSKNSITSYYNWYSYDFNIPYILRNGKTYQLYLKSPSSDNTKCYQVKVLKVSDDSVDQSKTPLLATTYAGENAICAHWNGSDWLPYKFRDMVFYFFSATYRISGQFISKAFDAGSSSEFKKISWEPVTQPSQTNLKFQIAASDNSGGVWLFLGPDGTEDTYYTEAIGEAISSRHSGKRYIKYKAFFDTSDSGYSPHLDKVTIGYDARPLSGRSLEAYNTPNPFEAGRELTTISYILEKDCRVYIRIYTLLGDLVKEMKFSPGSEGGRGESDGYENNVSWDGKNGRGMLVADGVYLSQIIAEPEDGSKIIKEIRKIAVIK